MTQAAALLTRDAAQGVSLLDVAATPVAPVITTTALPNGRVGQAYSQVVQATGTPSPTAAITAGALPAGLALTGSTRRISGTPTTPVASTFDVTVTNSAGSDVESLAILVPNEGTGGDAPVVTTVTLVPAAADVLPGATVDLLLTIEDQDGAPIANLDGAVTVEGAHATAEQLALTDASGQATVRVTGVTTGAAGVYVTVDGVRSNTAAVTVLEAVTVTSVTVVPDTASINSGAQVQLSAIVTGTGDFSQEVVWTLQSGGGSVAAGVYTAPSSATTAVVRATSVLDPSKWDEATITVAAPAVAPSVTTMSLPDAQVGVPYGATLAATGTTPIVWSIVSGPSWLTINGATLGGAPVAPGDVSVAVRAQNIAGMADRTFTVSVNPAAAAVSAVFVSPATPVISSTQQQVFSAVVVGASPSQEVTWDLFGAGSFDPITLVFTPDGPGTSTLRATSVQDPNVYGEASIEVVASDVVPPDVSLTASSLTVTEPGSIVLTANATDNIGVQSVTFFRDGKQIGQAVTNAPFRRLLTCASSADNGTYAFTARARDTEGNSTLSAPLSITVNIQGEPLLRSAGLADMIEIPRKDTTRAVVFSLTAAEQPLSGVVPVINLAKNGQTPQPATGVASETQMPGTYVFMPSEEDVNTEGDLLVLVRAQGADPVAPIRARVVTPYGRR